MGKRLEALTRERQSATRMRLKDRVLGSRGVENSRLKGLQKERAEVE